MATLRRHPLSHRHSLFGPPEPPELPSPSNPLSKYRPASRLKPRRNHDRAHCPVGVAATHCNLPAWPCHRHCHRPELLCLQRPHASLHSPGSSPLFFSRLEREQWVKLGREEGSAVNHLRSMIVHQGITYYCRYPMP